MLFSEPKIPQFEALRALQATFGRFSALQRAENSSILQAMRVAVLLARFQCSSASRKFLNQARVHRGRWASLSFSALQRAENSSISIFDRDAHSFALSFSALQRAENSSIFRFGRGVEMNDSFSALQRAENSSIMAHRSQSYRDCE